MPLITYLKLKSRYSTDSYVFYIAGAWQSPKMRRSNKRIICAPRNIAPDFMSGFFTFMFNTKPNASAISAILNIQTVTEAGINVVRTKSVLITTVDIGMGTPRKVFIGFPWFLNDKVLK